MKSVIKTGLNKSKITSKNALKRNAQLRKGKNLAHVEPIFDVSLSKEFVMKSLSEDYKIGRVRAAMVHEGHRLTAADQKILRDCASGKVSAQEIKAIVIAKHTQVRP